MLLSIDFMIAQFYNKVNIKPKEGVVMTEYIMTETEYKEDIIDFINYVFSQNRCPHDFKTLMPKSYSDEVDGLGAVHHLIREDGKIKALIANRIIETVVCGKTLRYGLIGNVSVHPYSRGKGYMKDIMKRVIEDARKREVDVLVLSGQRQRYAYFGFEPAGTIFDFVVNRDNIRHSMAEVDTSDVSFLPFEQASREAIHGAKKLYERCAFHAVRNENEFPLILKTGNSSCYIIHINGVMAGYCHGPFGEIVLEEESDFPKVLKALFEKEGVNEVCFSLHPYHKERIAYLARLCEYSRLRPVEQIKILNWAKAFDALFALKATYARLEDGMKTVCVGGETICISVHGGIPQVVKADEPCSEATTWNENDALCTFFGLDTLFGNDSFPQSWVPLTLPIDGPDTY